MKWLLFNAIFFKAHRYELRDFSLTIHNNESSLFAALNMVCSWCCKTHGV